MRSPSEPSRSDDTGDLHIDGISSFKFQVSGCRVVSVLLFWDLDLKLVFGEGSGGLVIVVVGSTIKCPIFRRVRD